MRLSVGRQMVQDVEAANPETCRPACPSDTRKGWEYQRAGEAQGCGQGGPPARCARVVLEVYLNNWTSATDVHCNCLKW